MNRITVLLAATVLCTPPLGAQSIENPTRLAGNARVQVRAEAVWDEMITMSAGGGTQDQFRGALAQTFEGTLAEAEAAPRLVPGAPTTVACHVDTFYETGVILYALRVQLERPGDDGEPIVTWIKSWVGSYSVQQMHLMFMLGEQCANAFLEDWRANNE